jgi:hypothetical protein
VCLLVKLNSLYTLAFKFPLVVSVAASAREVHARVADGPTRRDADKHVPPAVVMGPRQQHQATTNQRNEPQDAIDSRKRPRKSL